jgi:hypothetical protein
MFDKQIAWQTSIKPYINAALKWVKKKNKTCFWDSLTFQPRLTLNSESSYLSLLSAGIAGVPHYT